MTAPLCSPASRRVADCLLFGSGTDRGFIIWHVTSWICEENTGESLPLSRTGNYGQYQGSLAQGYQDQNPPLSDQII
ncbi:Hypothetical protein SMAX5B_019495 [Scophthalmus maximus]|uniref:Uncharacterized protein n=1 Tax=Scophthalmus maximus TaxID=52904 RepID=A0A2U9B124_SCOMX|nr:Hypothetical protein SMAX5B_019495 [Scophthalmus maximus]